MAVIGLATCFLVVSLGTIFNAIVTDDRNLPVLAMLIGMAFVVLLMIQIGAAVRLCLALGDDWAVSVYVLLTFIPVISLFTLVALNLRATNRLNQAGIRVGPFGATTADLASYRETLTSTPCGVCGEFVSRGVHTCPMCGATL